MNNIANIFQATDFQMKNFLGLQISTCKYFGTLGGF